MAILILNAGSSSLKFSLYDKEKILAGHIDRIGKNALLKLQAQETTKSHKVTARTHEQAGQLVLQLLNDFTITKVLHRVVHGGNNKKPLLLNKKNLSTLKKLSHLAPLHMPPSIHLMQLFHNKLQAKQYACFDTLFHTTIPDTAATYALPPKLRKKHKIHRYGFHGFAHKDLAEQAATKLKKPLSKLNVITCQLGNGVSLCAIKHGKSIDTTMGYTPLEGMIMGTRSGSIDPAIPLLLCEHGMKPAKVHELLEKESGLLALAGSNDVRDLLKKAKKGNKADLALDIFSYHIKKQLGAYIAALGKVDCIVLGGGIASSPEMRKRILSNLEHLHIKLDPLKLKQQEPLIITKGALPVFVTQPDEEKQMLKSV